MKSKMETKQTKRMYMYTNKHKFYFALYVNFTSGKYFNMMGTLVYSCTNIGLSLLSNNHKSSSTSHLVCKLRRTLFQGLLRLT